MTDVEITTTSIRLTVPDDKVMQTAGRQLTIRCNCTSVHGNLFCPLHLSKYTDKLRAQSLDLFQGLLQIDRRLNTKPHSYHVTAAQSIKHAADALVKNNHLVSRSRISAWLGWPESSSMLTYYAATESMVPPKDKSPAHGVVSALKPGSDDLRTRQPIVRSTARNSFKRR